MVAGCDNCGKPPELTRYLYLQLDQGEEGGAGHDRLERRNLFAPSPDEKPMGHLCGACAGLLVGVFALQNRRVR